VPASWQAPGVSIANLEAALLEAFDREHLAVYADALQSRGDPRGELIAIDLHIDAYGSTAELAARRGELIAAWLGNVAARWDVRVRYGFIHVSNVNADDIGSALTFPYLRGIDAYGLGAELIESVAKLAEEPRRWLATLRLEAPSNVAGWIVSPELGAAVIRATPRLELLDIHGPRVLGDVVHPRVRRLRVTGHDAVASLTQAGPAWPRVTDLDYAFNCRNDEDARRPDARMLAKLLAVARLPALRRLDLSRNEPGLDGWPNYLGGSVDVLQFVRELELGAQLTHLRLPSLRGEQQLADAQAALAGMQLVEIEVAREYGHGHAANLWHPSAKLVVPASVGWPPLDLVDGCDGLYISFPEPKLGGRFINFCDIVRFMEHSYAELPADARGAWDEFWRLEDLLALDDAVAPGKTREISVPAGVLLRALEPASFHLCESKLRDFQFRGSTLRDELRTVAPDVEVRMIRDWSIDGFERRRRVRPAGGSAGGPYR
jgi:hypothetical protein